MKRFMYFLLAATILFSYTHSSAKSKSRLLQKTKVKQEKILKRFEQGKSLLNQNSHQQSKELSSKSTELHALPDSAIVNNNDGSSEKYFYRYDGNKLIEEIYEYWENNSAINIIRSTFTYDAKGNETLHLEQILVGVLWQNSSRKETEYDTEGYITSRLFSDWVEDNWEAYLWQTYEYSLDRSNKVLTSQDWEDGSWVPSARYTDIYDENSNRINSIIEFENDDGILENWRKSEYTYDENGNRLTWSNFWWTDGTWDETYRYVYEYDAEHRMISSNYLSNSGSGSLKIKKLSLYSYFPGELKEASVTYEYTDCGPVPISRISTYLNTNGDRVYILYEDFDMGVLNWVNSFQYSFTYTDDFKPTGYVGQYWNSHSSTWENAEKRIREYDTGGNTTYLSYQYWEDGAWVLSNSSLEIEISEDVTLWYFGGEVYLYYGDFVTAIDDLDTLPSQFKLEQNYPNPFNLTTKIRYQLSKESRIKLEIYDFTGRLLATLIDAKQAAGTYSYNFNAESVRGGLTSGTYIFRLTSDGFSETKKMLLIK